MSTDIVIVAAARTAVGKFGGSLAKIPATELGSIVIREAIARAKLDPAQVGEVIMGQVLAAGCGQDPKDNQPVTFSELRPLLKTSCALSSSCHAAPMRALSVTIDPLCGIVKVTR